MSRLIPMMDARKRDAQVAADWPERAAPYRQVGPGGREVTLARLIKATDKTSFDALRRVYEDTEALARALVTGDPEIDLDQVARPMADASRVYVKRDGTVLYTARELQVVYGPDGTEKSRADFVVVEATVTEEGAPLVWSGRFVPADEVVKKYAFFRKLQLRHVSGLTFDYLFDIAKTLEDAGKLLYVGAGPKGQSPLIFGTNGTPYRGFLEGRVKGESYKLVLHLSNLEIKSVLTAGGDVGAT